MTMLVKSNWNEKQGWYEVPLDADVHSSEIDTDEIKSVEDYRYIAWYDRFSKNWIAYIVDAANHQIGEAYFAHSKRTFMY